MLDRELESVFRQIWFLLREGIQSDSSAFGMAQLATVGLNAAPRVRAVIIRRVSESSREISFNTDFRSVYGALVEKWFDASASVVVGGEYPILDLV